MTHTKNGSGSCTSKVWWQDELVLDKNSNCLSNVPINLYIAGDYGNVLNGEVRNFSYFKK